MMYQEAEARGEDYERVKYMKLSAADAEKILEEKERREQGADHGFSGRPPLSTRTDEN